MNREILFRGKWRDNGEWEYGSLVIAKDAIDEQQRTYILEDADFYGYGEFTGVCDVDPATIGQYTGLTDKNGEKIFEGDIVECWSEGVCAQGTVQQNKGGLWIIYPAWQKRIMWGLCPDEYGGTDVEIIGNIHDNPELLKV